MWCYVLGGSRHRGALVAAIVACSAVSFYRVAPNTILMDFMRQFTQNYTRGFATKTTDEMMEIVVEAATELGLTQKGSERLRERTCPFLLAQQNFTQELTFHMNAKPLSGSNLAFVTQ